MTLFCFTGCASTETNEIKDTTTMEQIAEAIITNFAAMSETDFEQFENMSDFKLNYTMMASNLPIEAADFRQMIDSWQTAVEENGLYLKHEEYKVETKSTGVTLTTNVKFEDKDTTISFVFDNKSNLVSLNVSGQMTTSSIFKKAGLNTILCMGIVFVVLILLAFMIYLMKYIPKLINGESLQENKPKTVPVTVSDTVNEQGVAYVDDLELVAVITAAIAAQEGKSADGFVVRSIRRRPSNHWI